MRIAQWGTGCSKRVERWLRTTITRTSAAIGLWIILSSLALTATASTITYTALFLDNRQTASSFGSSGTFLQIEAGIFDPLGVPGNINTVYATHTHTGQSYFMPFRPFGNFTTPTFGPYFALPSYGSVPLSSRSGQYDIFAVNNQGDTVSATTHALFANLPLNFARNISIEGPTQTPTIRWDPVPGANAYELRIWDVSGNLLYDTPWVGSPSFAVPTGILSPNSNYHFGIISLDLDSGGNIERRSFYWRDYSTTPPPPPAHRRQAR